ncbi:LysR family transcriptional regulator [Polaromonas sp. SM01]|uniref:LysR family transcriptional regulator n=1 Tax=Polaromonas sp. SM01 TaxID=3085630 RepID=UPI002982A1C5|nr:LysR family transcriptional regulator [Polaromonas sp. SM01]MDW5441420.1 LysR family transcriptional regulator [Polaromonas sp. SM01]
MKSVDAVVRRVTLRELRLLAAIAHAGSILKAAQDVGLSQPALSKALADLEETLGVRLFDRTNRGVEPTPHGRVFIRRALAVFDEMRRGVEELNVLSDSSGGEIRLGGTPTMCGGFLSHAVASMALERPGIRYKLLELESERLATEVRSRLIDIGIGREPLVRPDGELSFERLFDDPLYVVAGADHPLARRRRLTLADLANQRWVLPMPETPVSGQLRAAFEHQGAAMPESIVTSMSVLVRQELLSTNRFLTVLYGSMLQFGNMPSHLRILPVELSARLPIGVYKLEGRTLSPATELFIDSLKTFAARMCTLSVDLLQRALRDR